LKRRWPLYALMIIFTLLIITRFSGLQQLTATLASGLWYWILLSLALHMLYFIIYGGMYVLGFRIVGVESTLAQTVPVYFVSLFVNSVAPLGGTGGAAVFIDNSVRRGESGARTSVGLLLVLASDLITLWPFLAYTVWYLIQQQIFKFYSAVGVAIYLIFTGLLLVALIAARHKSQQLASLLGHIRNLTNRIGGRLGHAELLGADWVERTVRDMSSASQAIFNRPGMLVQLTAAGLILHVINVVGLYFLFLAFHQPVSPGVLIAGFSVGIVYWVISIIPQAIGAVEGIMGLIFTSAGISGPEAAAVIVTFRGMNYWIPLIIGFLASQRTPAFTHQSEKEAAE
jgi:uncharacterized protein (TIRG00374 family)